jgi:hypothetical protein
MNRDREFRTGRLITPIRSGWHPPQGFQKDFANGMLGKRSAGTMPLPCFRPDSPEDSLFLPRCGHALRSHSVLGAGKWGDCQNDHQSQRALGIDTSNNAFYGFRRAIAGGGRR